MAKAPAKRMPAVKAPKPEIEDRGTIRLGDASITAEFPPLKRPGPDIADAGTIRLGDASVTAEFPV